MKKDVYVPTGKELMGCESRYLIDIMKNKMGMTDELVVLSYYFIYRKEVKYLCEKLGIEYSNPYIDKEIQDILDKFNVKL